MQQRLVDIMLYSGMWTVSTDAKYTPECLDTIIKGLKEKGFEIVPISQLIHKDNYYMDVEGRQILNN